MSDEVVTTLNYQDPPDRRRASVAIRVGTLSALVADVALLTAVFIWNGGHVWGPYLNPPVTVSWAQPIFLASLLLGLVGVIASGVGLVRPASGAWKVAAAGTSVGYLVGFACVAIFGLL